MEQIFSLTYYFEPSNSLYAQVKRMNIVKGQGVPDFVLLDELTENATYENLKLRFTQDQIYVSINNTAFLGPISQDFSLIL